MTHVLLLLLLLHFTAVSAGRLLLADEWPGVHPTQWQCSVPGRKAGAALL
jgi:hypothetical protein